jgi:hypothetical protein
MSFSSTSQEVRSTEHALSATVNEIEKGLHEKEFVVVTLLDIKGAIDNIKPSAIIKAMKKQGVRQKVCNMYHQYLTNRRCSYTLSDKIVVATPIMGSPQGGLLSPFCGWNCAMNELVKRLYAGDQLTGNCMETKTSVDLG